MAAKVSDGVARTVRGGVQGGVGYAVAQIVEAFHHLTVDQFGAIVVGVTLVVTFFQNLAENKGIIPALLKSVPAKGDTPVVDTTETKP